MKNVEIRTSIREDIVNKDKTLYSGTVETKDIDLYNNIRNHLSNITRDNPRQFEEKRKLFNLILDYDRPLHNDCFSVDEVVDFVNYLLKNGVEVPSAFRIYGGFQQYCNKHSSCDKCDKRIKRLCERKSRLMKKQETIIKEKGL